MKIVKEQQISKQDVLEIELEKRGFDVKQSTISRDLKELKIKRRNGDSIYTLDEDVLNNIQKEKLKRIAKGNVTGVFSDAYVFAIKTNMGYSRVLAYEIEQSYKDEVIGTIAGEDTIIVITKSKSDMKNISYEIQESITNKENG